MKKPELLVRYSY